MAILRLFASAREAAGRTSDDIQATTVGGVLDEACRRYGDRFASVLRTSQVWLNGEPAERTMIVAAPDVVAVLPPVSGGSKPKLVAQPFPVRRTMPIVRGNLALVPDLEPDPEPGPVAEPLVEAAVPVPIPEAVASATAERPPLAVIHRSVRPHGRLGLVWAVVTVAVAIAGPGWLAGWLAVAAFVAGAQVSVVWHKRGERSLTFVAAAVAAGLPVAAAFSAGAISGVVVAGLLVAFLARLRRPSKAPSRDIALTLAIGVPIGFAAAAPVLVRHTGISATLLLLAYACVYDASAYLVGTGATSAWEGPAAGVVAFIPLTIFATVALIPPFRGAEPLLLGLIAAALAPAGPVAASALLGDRAAHAPALRRLDSLLLMGPLWAWCAAVMIK